MKFTESPVNGRPAARQQQRLDQRVDQMPIHLNGVLMSTTQFKPYRTRAPDLLTRGPDQGALLPRAPDTMPTISHRTSSLEMLNNVNDFEEKRAFIASTLSLNDLLKPSAQDFRGSGPPMSQHTQFNPMLTNSYMTMSSSSMMTSSVNNGYMLPQSLLKPNTNGYNVNFLNNGIPDKDLGKFILRYKHDLREEWQIMVGTIRLCHAKTVFCCKTNKQNNLRNQYLQLEQLSHIITRFPDAMINDTL